MLRIKNKIRKTEIKVSLCKIIQLQKEMVMEKLDVFDEKSKKIRNIAITKLLKN